MERGERGGEKRERKKEVKVSELLRSRKEKKEESDRRRLQRTRAMKITSFDSCRPSKLQSSSLCSALPAGQRPRQERRGHHGGLGEHSRGLARVGKEGDEEKEGELSPFPIACSVDSLFESEPVAPPWPPRRESFRALIPRELSRKTPSEGAGDEMRPWRGGRSRRRIEKRRRAIAAAFRSQLRRLLLLLVRSASCSRSFSLESDRTRSSFSRARKQPGRRRRRERARRSSKKSVFGKLAIAPAAAGWLFPIKRERELAFRGFPNSASSHFYRTCREPCSSWTR